MESIFKILLAFFLGLVVGFEREIHHSPAGIRTYAAVCMGACVFALASTHATGAAYYQSVVDPTRIAAQIVTGVGFLGGGVIFRDGSKTNGLTTAATIWVIAAVGLAVAFKMLLVAIVTTALVLLLLSLNHTRVWQDMKNRARERFKKSQPSDPR